MEGLLLYGGGGGGGGISIESYGIYSVVYVCGLLLWIGFLYGFFLEYFINKNFCMSRNKKRVYFYLF